MTEPTPPPTYKVTSEEEIQAYSVGGVKRHDAPITLVDYDPRMAGAVRPRGGQDPVDPRGSRRPRSHHTGSTSVPGLAAKPVIDITMRRPRLIRRAGLRPGPGGGRLPPRDPRARADWFDHRVFKGPDTNVNLHVFSPGCQEIERMVGFRDWLRTHDDDRELYERTKRDLVDADLGVRPELRRREDRGRRGDRGAGRAAAAGRLTAGRRRPRHAHRWPALTAASAVATVRSTP